MGEMNLIKFEEKKITLKYETQSLIFELQKNPTYGVGTEYIDYQGGRYFLTKTKS